MWECETQSGGKYLGSENVKNVKPGMGAAGVAILADGVIIRIERAGTSPKEKTGGLCVKHLLFRLAVIGVFCLGAEICLSLGETDMYRLITDSDDGSSPPVNLAFGDSIFGFDCENPADDNQCLGVEFVDGYFYITGGGGTSGPDSNQLHFFDRDGNYLTSLDQPTTSYWGWRDMAFDGNHIYSSDSDSVVEWFVTGLPDSPVLNIVGSFPGPLDPNRAMAYDPVSDHFYTASWASDIYEFDRAGSTVGNWSNSYSIYGMAWDDASPDGPWLWIFTQEAPGAIVYQWDPVNHVYTGLALELTHVSGIAGGVAFTADWDPSLGVLFCLHQTNPDLVVGYEITPLCKPVEPPEMRSQGYWRRQCKDDAHEGICAHMDSVYALADLFDDFDCNSACDLLNVDPPERNMCRKARRQFLAVLLNVASGKLSVCNCLEDGRTVGEVIAEVDSLLGGSPDRALCEYAKSVCDYINTGESMVPCSGPTPERPSGGVQIADLVRPGVSGGRVVLEYELVGPQRVRLEIYNSTGRLVRKLVDGRQGPGTYEVVWDGLDERGERVPSGVCFGRLETGRIVRSGKLVLLR
jgi:hypothetical protein